MSEIKTLNPKRMSHHPKRDVTIALNLLKTSRPVRLNYGGKLDAVVGRMMANWTYTQLITVLKNIDARTGRRDPSKRKKPARKR